MFEQQFKCKMPWSKSSTDLCQIGQNPDYSYDGLLQKWGCYKKGGYCYDPHKKASVLHQVEPCFATPSCKRSIYEINYQPLLDRVHGTQRSLLKIQLSSPYVQVVQDSNSYDFQSFIGEVGGTLGLTLGLSFLSLVNLLEYSVTKLFPANH